MSDNQEVSKRVFPSGIKLESFRIDNDVNELRIITQNLTLLPFLQKFYYKNKNIKFESFHQFDSDFYHI